MPDQDRGTSKALAVPNGKRLATVTAAVALQTQPAVHALTFACRASRAWLPQGERTIFGQSDAGQTVKLPPLVVQW
jgi:hypothetical protein